MILKIIKLLSAHLHNNVSFSKHTEDYDVRPHKKTKKEKREARDPRGVYVGVYVVFMWHLRGVYVLMVVVVVVVVVVETGFANLPELEFSSNTNNQS
jgi:hypothetical protein